MIQMINVQILLFGFLSTSNGFDLQCPHPSQRTYRIQNVCNGNASAYTCLYDTKKKGYVEFCANRKDNYVRAGLKYVISGTFRNVRCSDGRYQPVRFLSNQRSVCMYFKSECNCFGETVYNNRSSIYDATCRCDFTRGYAFVSKPRNKCFCIPSEEDCSCYIKQCPTNTTLSPDYECIYVGLANENFYCQHDIKRQKHAKETDTAISFEDNEQLKSRNRSVRIGLSSLFLGSSTILVILGLIYVKYDSFPCRTKDKGMSRLNKWKTKRNEDSPELYDLENESSIAPSDIDVSYYYGASRHGKDQSYRDNYKKQLSKTNGHGQPANHWNSNGALIMQTTAMQNRNSPANMVGPQHFNFNRLKLLESSSYEILNDSFTCSEFNYANDKGRSDFGPSKMIFVKGLTVEEIDKLNARHSRPSPVSMLEAVSSSSKENRLNQQYKTIYHLDDGAMLEPLDSSSDESNNVSFTCSEFEYENIKGRSDFDPSAMSFSKVAEVDNENEDLNANHIYWKNGGVDSNGKSFAPSKERRRNSSPVNGAINWDYFTDWGPSFEKLVGVFKDIASLPDGNGTSNNDMDCKTETYKEIYV